MTPSQPFVNQLQTLNTAITDAPAKSTRLNPPESPLTELSSDAKDDIMVSSVYYQFATLAESAPKAADIPKNLKDAFNGLDIIQWKVALDEELTSLVEKKVFRVVLHPKGPKVISVEPVMHIKVNAEGRIECYNLCLVAHEYN